MEDSEYFTVLGEDFFGSVATASEWQELVDAEDHNLLKIWRQMYVEAHNSQLVDVPFADRVLPHDILEMVTVQLSVNDSVTDKAGNSQLDGLIDFQGIIPSSPSITASSSSVSEDNSSAISIFTPETEQNQTPIANSSSVPSTSSSTAVSPDSSQNLSSVNSATSIQEQFLVTPSPVGSIVGTSVSDSILTHQETIVAKHTSTVTPDSSCRALLVATPPVSARTNPSTCVSKQVSIVTPKPSLCTALSLLSPPLSAPENSSSHPASSSCRALVLLSPPLSAPENSSSHPAPSSCRALALSSPPEISTPKLPLLTPQRLQNNAPQIQNQRQPLAEVSNNTVVTPVQTNTTPNSRHKNSKIPSPFKRALLCPEPKNNKLRKTGRERFIHRWSHLKIGNVTTNERCKRRKI